jgi:molybdate transport system permease protein
MPNRKPEWWWLASLPLLLFLLVPLLTIFARANWATIFSTLLQTQVLQAIGISLSTSLVSTGLVVALGTPLSLLLARKNLRFKKILDALIDLPAVLPPAVAGLALLLAFGRRGSVGAPLADLGITLAFTPLAVVLAQVFVAAPFYIKSAAAGFAAVDEELQQAAALDGANRWKIFRYITAPLAWGAVLGGAVMTWARALGEFGATIIFAGNFTGRTQTMPLAIYLGLELSVEVALTLSLVLIGLSFLALVVVKGLLHREWR